MIIVRLDFRVYKGFSYRGDTASGFRVVGPGSFGSRAWGICSLGFRVQWLQALETTVGASFGFRL